MRNFLHYQVFQDIVIPNEAWLLHQIVTIWLIRLASPELLLLADTQVSVVREVEARALTITSIEQPLKIFLGLG